MEDRYNGSVKWFDSEKGFGFIQLEDGSKELFVHHSEVQNKGYGRVSLEDGQKVSFLVGDGLKGEQAKSVETL